MMTLIFLLNIGTIFVNLLLKNIQQPVLLEQYHQQGTVNKVKSLYPGSGG